MQSTEQLRCVMQFTEIILGANHKAEQNLRRKRGGRRQTTMSITPTPGHPTVGKSEKDAVAAGRHFSAGPSPGQVERLYTQLHHGPSGRSSREASGSRLRLRRWTDSQARSIDPQARSPGQIDRPNTEPSQRGTKQKRTPRTCEEVWQWRTGDGGENVRRNRGYRSFPSPVEAAWAARRASTTSCSVSLPYIPRIGGDLELLLHTGPLQTDHRRRSRFPPRNRRGAEVDILPPHQRRSGAPHLRPRAPRRPGLR